MRILFYHSTEFPTVEGREAAKLFMPVADTLAQMGHTVGIVAPRNVELPFPWPECVKHVVFTHLEPMLRMLQSAPPDLLVLFTDKPEQKRIEEKARGNGCSVLFSELGFRPHYRSLYFDKIGCGPTSSLCHMIPTTNEFHAVGKQNNPDGPVLVLLQLEQDYNFRASPYPSNAAFIDHVRRAWGDVRVIVRTHPAMGVEQPKLTDQAKQCSAVIGLNTSALFECLELGMPCYMLAEGPGRHSGAFLTDLKEHPRHANMDCPEKHTRLRRARMLLAELLEHRQIRLDREITPGVILGNTVLGEALSGDHLSRAS